VREVRAEDYDALLLDFGNVLVEIDFSRVTAHWAAAARIEPAVLASRFSHDEPYRRHERAEIGIGDYFAALRANLGLELDDDTLLEGWNAVFVKEIPEVVATLPRLAGRLPLYLFSNTNHAHHQFFARRYEEALAHFRRLFVSHELGARKPEPEAFLKVADAIGVAPERVLFFDDLPENIEGARQAGMPGVLVSSPGDFVQAVRTWLE
jgi:HAD superfamily hydrolase (TIGR01509 family)